MEIRIRRGRLKDLAFVRKLAVNSVKFGIPHTRKISVEEVISTAREAGTGLAALWEKIIAGLPA